MVAGKFMADGGKNLNHRKTPPPTTSRVFFHWEKIPGSVILRIQPLVAGGRRRGGLRLKSVAA